MINVVLISTYELGRQSFGLASPAAWLKEAGASVTCLDLATQRLATSPVAAADLVAFYVPMHTATRLAIPQAARVQQINPRAHLCFYGLYAPVNESLLRKLGAQTILGGEFEEGLVSLVERLAAARDGSLPPSEQPEPTVSLAKQQFRIPDRSGLPALDVYAHLTLGENCRRTVGYTEASRGCKHLCRHCPIVPVYGGQFRVIQRDVVLEDIRRQVTAGARHITFGDPDFFNGPGHALAIVQALHQEWPELTYDVTIKIEHLLQHARHLPALRATGCLFVTSAVEAIDDHTLRYLDKGHTRQDFIRAVRTLRQTGLAMQPTFVTFTPWTTVAGYVDLLKLLFELELVDYVAPVQYAIRLLIPAGSRLLELPAVQELVAPFDEEALVYPWVHPDPVVDRLYEAVLAVVKRGLAQNESRRAIFAHVWAAAQAADEQTRMDCMALAAFSEALPQEPIPFLSEPWYC